MIKITFFQSDQKTAKDTGYQGHSISESHTMLGPLLISFCFIPTIVLLGPSDSILGLICLFCETHFQYSQRAAFNLWIALCGVDVLTVLSFNP